MAISTSASLWHWSAVLASPLASFGANSISHGGMDFGSIGDVIFATPDGLLDVQFRLQHLDGHLPSLDFFPALRQFTPTGIHADCKPEGRQSDRPEKVANHFLAP